MDWILKYWIQELFAVIIAVLTWCVRKLLNPTNQTALPLIITAGSGSLQVGGRTVSIASNSYDSISIDCERMECYSGANNCNSLITASDGFPDLSPGETGITWRGFTSVKVTPRWFKI